jgi:hypothetical protein
MGKAPCSVVFEGVAEVDLLDDVVSKLGCGHGKEGLRADGVPSSIMTHSLTLFALKQLPFHHFPLFCYTRI